MNIFGKTFGKSNSADMSLPRAKTIHGIEVKKVPIGKYLAAMREIENLPERIIKDLFPGLNISQIWATFTEMNDQKLIDLVSRLIVISPEYIIKVISLILDVPEEKIMNELTPKELKDVLVEYWALNDMTDFFGAVSGLIKKTLPTLASGFKNGLQ